MSGLFFKKFRFKRKALNSVKMDIFSTIDSLVHSFEKVAPTFAPTGKWTQKLKDLDMIFEEMAMLSNSLHQSRKGDIKDFEVNRVIS